MTIKEAQIEANRIATEKGFWDDYNNIPKEVYNNSPTHEIGEHKQKWIEEQHLCTKLALIITEISEAIEARRKGKFAVTDTIVQIQQETNNNPNEDQCAYIESSFKTHIKDTYEDELADAAIRLFDLAEKTGVDLTWHIQQKMIYNSSRSKMHGKKY